MDLRVYSLQKLTKEKRERQPNWTEPEKQLLLSLTRMHQPILENKGSDTMTIKRKSQAWDEIALHMTAAGYNRSKERLKQQLGRIRAAGAKRAKEALENSVITSPLKSCSSFSIDNQILKNDFDLHSNVKHASLGAQEEIQIKVEKSTSVDDEFSGDSSEILTPCSRFLRIRDIFATGEDDTIPMLKNVHSLTENRNYSDDTFHEANNSKDNTSENGNYTTHHRVPTRANSAVLSDSYSTTNVRSDENPNLKSYHLNSQRQHQPSRIVRLSGISTPDSREQRLRQIHRYRIAVERERLRGLKQQQKRDRILYRKDVQIQNLKLQILRNLTNSNTDGNCINF